MKINDPKVILGPVVEAVKGGTTQRGGFIWRTVAPGDIAALSRTCDRQHCNGDP